MPRPLFDSEYIFGLHEPGGEQLMIEAGRPGWVLFTEAVGRDPNDYSGKDFSPWSNRNLGVICRINHGYYPAGTIPNSAFYADFARRCANYVANSPGCKIWIIGNEMNYEIERPSLMTRGLPAAASVESSPTSAAEAKGPAGDGLTSPVKDMFKAVLRGLSSGMVDAELFPPPAETAESGEAANDPFYRGAPQRFNALTEQTTARGSVAVAAAPQPTEVITPDLYVRCYRLCREAIRRVPGHANDQVIVGAVAPWNDQTKYPGNPNGDWVQYLQDILRLLGPTGCDGVAIH
nr:hypothetical protein [Caldilineaceae bacterium]